MKRRRILFMPMLGGVGWGPVAQLLAVAEQAAISGWEVTFLCPPRFIEFLGGLGYQCHAAIEPDPVDVPFVDYRLGDVMYCSGVANAGFLRAQLALEASVIVAEQPSVLMSALSITAPISAARHGIPLISIAAGADLPWFDSPLYSESPYSKVAAEVINSVLEPNETPVLDVGELSFLRSQRSLAPTWKGFDPLLEKVENVAFVGPLRSVTMDLLGPSVDEELSSVGLVLCYLNSGSLHPAAEVAVVQHVCEAFPKHTVIWIGGRPISNCPNLLSPKRVALARLLNMASFLVSGGGYNAMLSAVERGIPILALPGHSAERHYFSSVIDKLSAGNLVPGYYAEELIEAPLIQALPEQMPARYANPEGLQEEMSGPSLALIELSRVVA